MTTERRCGSCKRPMRRVRVRAADAPGTVQEGARGLCSTCQDHPEGHTPQVPMDWLSQECEDCGKGLRPPRSHAADYPGRVWPARKELCKNCYDKRAELTAPPCKVDGCEMKAKRTGKCNHHYMQAYHARRSSGPATKPAPAPCSVEGCDAEARCRGMCNTHYRRVWRSEKRALLPQCAVEGCERVIRAEGLCASHYSAQQREKKRAKEREKKQAQREATPQHEVTDPGLLRFYARRNTRLNSRTRPKLRRTSI